MIARETIYAAFYGLVSSVSGFKTSSRRLKFWSDVADTDQPALFVVQEEEDAMSKSTTLPPIYTLRCTIYIYARNTDPDASPAATLNPLVDAVEGALRNSNGPTPQTLDGKVTSVQIDGKIMYDGGALEDQAVAIIPVKIIVAGT